LALLIATQAWASQGEVTIDASTTGDRSELIETVPIERVPGRGFAAMTLGQGSMPVLERGDRLRVSAEFLVTTDCTFRSARCAGAPYVFNPVVDTAVVLMNGSDEIELAADRRKCFQKPGQRQHHCAIPFHGIEAGDAANRLRCESGGCSLEVRVRAWSPRANGDQRLAIGAIKPNGRVVQDRARLNAIRVRPGTAALLPATRTGLRAERVPPTLEKVVIYSQRLERLKQGEVLEAWIDARGSVAGLDYSALIGSQIVLAESPQAAHGRTLVKRVASLEGEITEISGTNCTQSQSPCPIRRTGMVEMREDARTQSGDPVPLFVNVIARSTAKHAEPQSGDAVRIFDEGGLRVRRYGP